MKPREVVIGDCTFLVGLVETSAGIRAGATLMRAAGPGLVGLKSGFLGAIGELLKDPALGENLIEISRLLAPASSVIPPGSKKSIPLDVCFEQQFRGNYSAFRQWLEAAIDVNLSTFLDDIGGLLRRAQDAVSSISNAPPSVETTG